MITCGWCWTFCILRWPFRYQSLSPPCKSKLTGKKRQPRSERAAGRLMRCVFPLFNTILLFILLFVRAAYVCGGSIWVGLESGKQVRHQGDGARTCTCVKQGASVTLFGHLLLNILHLLLFVFSYNFCDLSNSFKYIWLLILMHKSIDGTPQRFDVICYYIVFAVGGLK